MSDNRVIEKLCYLTKDGGQKLLRETEVDSFTNIKTLKETTDKKDKFYIYKMNCKSVSGEPSYVFKTSTKALEIAKKMEQKETEGQRTNILSLEWAYMDGMHSSVRGYKTLNTMDISSWNEQSYGPCYNGMSKRKHTNDKTFPSNI